MIIVYGSRPTQLLFLRPNLSISGFIQLQQKKVSQTITVIYHMFFSYLPELSGFLRLIRDSKHFLGLGRFAVKITVVDSFTKLA